MPEEPIAGRSKHGQLTLDQMAELQPGLGRLMPEISDAYWTAYYAAKGGNWRLAGYCVRKVASLFKLGATTRPKFAARLDGYKAKVLEPLQKHVAAQDFAAFEATYREGIEEANRQHVETGRPEIVWRLPPNPPAHLDLGAR